MRDKCLPPNAIQLTITVTITKRTRHTMPHARRQVFHAAIRACTTVTCDRAPSRHLSPIQHRTHHHPIRLSCTLVASFFPETPHTPRVPSVFKSDQVPARRHDGHTATAVHDVHKHIECQKRVITNLLTTRTRPEPWAKPKCRGEVEAVAIHETLEESISSRIHQLARNNSSEYVSLKAQSQESVYSCNPWKRTPSKYARDPTERT